MKISRQELKERKTRLQDEIDQLEIQLQQAQNLLQSVPLMIASRRGEIIGIDKILNKEASANDKKND